MNKLKISSGFLTGIAVALLAVLAFILRVTLSYSQIFKGDWVKYASADAYYHMRLVDVTAINFPHMQPFDLYNIFPGGFPITGTTFFARFMATIASVFGIVDPSQRTIDIVGVFTPPVLAALTVVVVFFIGRELFGRWGGILSAGMLAIIPGEFFSRTKLGFTDYHCFEIFLTTLFILFLVLALKSARKNELTIHEILNKNWAAIKKPLIYSLLAGLAFVFYGLTWSGAPMFIFITFVFFIIQFVMDHLRKRDVQYLGIVGGITYLFAFIILVITLGTSIVSYSVLVAFLSVVGMAAVSWFMSGRDMKAVYYPLSILVLAGAGFGLFYLVLPNVVDGMLQNFAIFRPAGAQLTTIEMQPLISSSYGTGTAGALSIVWNNYNVTFYLAFAAMLIVAYAIYRKGDHDKTLFLVWCIVMLIANLGQRRFGYYYGVNVALLMGCLSWAVIDFARVRIFTDKVKQAIAKAKDVKTKALKNKPSTPVAVPYIVLSFVAVIVFFTVYFWSIETTVEAAKRVPYAPSDAWYSVLTWMKDNTPEPFGDADSYYELTERDGYSSYSNLLNQYPDETVDPLYYEELDGYYPYPDTAYGVTSWWDYGYWITRIAHRLPNANPSQDQRAIKDVASFLIAQDEETALEVAERLKSEYVLIDTETAYVSPSDGSGKFWAMVTWLDQEVSDYFDVFLVQDSEDTTKYRQAILYFPEYYRSMAVRMYNFNCEAVEPDLIDVIGYKYYATDSGRLVEVTDPAQQDADGVIKVVTEYQQFITLEEAEEYMATQEEGNYTIVSTSPMASAVPLEALEHYQVEYESPQGVQLTAGNQTASVKLFKHLD